MWISFMHVFDTMWPWISTYSGNCNLYKVLKTLIHYGSTPITYGQWADKYHDESLSNTKASNDPGQSEEQQHTEYVLDGR